MTPQNVFGMAVSDHAGWDDLARIPPSAAWMLPLLALPLSLLPPAMLYYAGSHHGDEFVAGFGGRNWALIALVFLLAEWLSVLGMGGVIRAIAAAHRVRCSYRDAYILATLAPVPLWLSSLILFIPSPLLAVGVSLCALGLAMTITYHGVRALCREREDVTAASMVYGVTSVGLIAWALLLVIVFPL